MDEITYWFFSLIPFALYGSTGFIDLISEAVFDTSSLSVPVIFICELANENRKKSKWNLIFIKVLFYGLYQFDE